MNQSEEQMTPVEWLEKDYDRAMVINHEYDTGYGLKYIRVAWAPHTECSRFMFTLKE